MAWSPIQRFNAGIIRVEQPGNYANPIPTTPATEPFITTFAHKGANVEVLAALAGHRIIGTTQRYIDLDDKVLRAAVEMI